MGEFWQALGLVNLAAQKCYLDPGSVLFSAPPHLALASSKGGLLSWLSNWNDGRKTVSHFPSHGISASLCGVIGPLQVMCTLLAQEDPPKKRYL